MTDIAVVVLDTLRKDAFDEHFGWLPGVRYENAWSTSGWTVPAHGSLFAGGYPSETGVYAKRQSLTTDAPVLAERLSAAGYTARGFSANANISDAFEFTRGFDRFDHSWRGRRRDEDVVDWGRFISQTRGRGPTRYLRALYRSVASDADTIKSLRLAAKLKARDLGIEAIAGADDGARAALELVRGIDFGDDEFLFLNLMEAHGPYDAPEPYRTVDLDDQPSFADTVGDGPDADPETVRQAYDDCVRYLADVYEELFGELAAAFDYVITLSDHGELFGTDGVWDHNHGIYPELAHVPLSVYRGRDESAVRERPVGLVDVHRTVLDLAGLPEAPSRGRNLLADGPRDADDARVGAGPDDEPPTPGSPLPADTHLVERFGLRTTRIEDVKTMADAEAVLAAYDAPLKGVVTPDGYGWETRDGFETTDGADPDDLRARLDRAVDRLDVAGGEAGRGAGDGPGEVPADVRDRLEELGYV